MLFQTQVDWQSAFMVVSGMMVGGAGATALALLSNAKLSSALAAHMTDSDGHGNVAKNQTKIDQLIASVDSMDEKVTWLYQEKRNGNR